MADLTTNNVWTPGETVSAYTSLSVAADATATAAADGTAAFTGLKPNRQYTLVGGTSGIKVNAFPGEPALGQSGPGGAASVREISVVFDPASVAAATAASQNVTAPTGTVDVGDTVLYIGRSGTGAVTCSVQPIVTKDTIPVLFVNGSAGAIDLASQTFRFLVIKKRTNL